MTCCLLPEWHEQDAILLAWPHCDTDWNETLSDIQRVYVRLIAQIIRFQRVVLIVHDTKVAHDAKSVLLANNIAIDKVLFIEAPYNDTWLRDTGPLACRQNNNIVLHDFRFNGWGGKFTAHLDDQLCAQLFKRSVFTSQNETHSIYLEGGSIDTDGTGSLLTTSRCLLTSTRNPAMTRSNYEDLFKQTFNIERVIWIEHGELQGDDTDSHIDMLARFCDGQTIAYTVCRDSSDFHFEPLKQLELELRSLRQENGQGYTLIPLELPQAQFNTNGERLPASYANFLIINQAVLVPVYDDEMDKAACRKLAACFPSREIIPVSANAIIQQGGSLHCLTMQLPIGSLVSQGD